MPGRRARTALALLPLALVAACGQDTTPAASGTDAGYGTVTVDSCGTELTFDRAPQDVLVIGGEAGTLVDAAGGADRVATYMPLVGEPLGDTETSMAEAETMPLQTASEMSREVVVGLAPDLVVTFGLSGFTPDDLAAAGIPTYVVAGYCGGFGAGQSQVQDPLEAVYADVEALGEVFGTAAEAQASVQALRGRVDAVAARGSSEAQSAAAVFAVDPQTALGAYGSRSMVHAQMDLLGLSNVFAGTPERYFEPSAEALVEAAPQVVVALYEAGDTSEADARAAVTERPEAADVPAVVDDEVLLLNFFYAGHGTLAVDGLEMLADQL